MRAPLLPRWLGVLPLAALFLGTAALSPQAAPGACGTATCDELPRVPSGPEAREGGESAERSARNAPIEGAVDDEAPSVGASPVPHVDEARGWAQAARPAAVNVNGDALSTCSTAPMTGFWRDGRCETGPEDTGVHVVCAQVTEAFLSFTRSRGNDLVTARGGFPGLREGDRWCLCASKWREALEAGVAPPVVIEATHEAALRFVTADRLRENALR